jgi:hypothetical protein
MLTQRGVEQRSDFCTSNVTFRIANQDQDYDISMSKRVDFKREERHNVQRGDIMMTLCHEQVIHDQSR